MKFGKQLQVQALAEWGDNLINYKKLKKILSRIVQEEKELVKRWIKNNKEKERERESYKDKDTELGIMYGHRHKHDEKSSLLDSGDKPPKATMRREEFHQCLLSYLDKSNKYYTAKVSEIALSMAHFETTQSSSYRSAVSRPRSSNTGLRRVKEIYEDISDLKLFVNLNYQGFRKIVKKYDKVLQEYYLPTWMARLKTEDFCVAEDLKRLEERMKALISPSKLLEFEHEIKLKRASLLMRGSDVSVPTIHPYRIFACSMILLTLLAIPPKVFGLNTDAARCLAVLIFSVSMWVSEAIPYFTTAMLVPILLVLLDVMEDPEHPGKR